MPAWFLRLAAPAISLPLPYLYNLSVSTSFIPDVWKVAILHPIPKINPPADCADFSHTKSFLVSSRDSSSRRLSTHYLKYLNTKINSTTNLPSVPPDLPLRHSFHSFTTSPVYSLFTRTNMSLPSIFPRRLTPSAIHP